MQAVTESFASDLFEGRHVIVSGASSGIGQAIARGFASLGAAVVATGSSAEKLAASERDPANRGVRFEALDVRDKRAAEAFIARQLAVDVLVNAQGIARPGAEWTEDTFLDVMDVNLNSAFRLSMAALPKLEASRGSIVNFASMLSYLADAEVPAYTASKTGIVGLTRALAHRFGPSGVRVNAIAPGYHRTDMTRALWENPLDEARIAGRSALKRWGSVDDLVGAVLFLSSPAAAFISGVTLPVDGGYHSG
ncbi:MAG: SDR family oxidoreductase [Methylobacterium mesophilicum]|nr:SDR family oxidoreductase [Methylobacterium mesophilicum]